MEAGDADSVSGGISWGFKCEAPACICGGQASGFAGFTGPRVCSDPGLQGLWGFRRSAGGAVFSCLGAGIFTEGLQAASLQAQACLETAALPWMCGLPSRIPNSSLHLRHCESSAGNAVSPTAGLSAPPPNLVISQRWKLLLIFSNGQNQKLSFRARDGSSWVGEENLEGTEIEICVFLLLIPGPSEKLPQDTGIEGLYGPHLSALACQEAPW